MHNAPSGTAAHFPTLIPEYDPMRLLLVEDVTSDAMLLRTALDRSGIAYDLNILRRGDEVLPWLTVQLKAGRPLPDAIMLDLGLPCMDGFEILAELTSADPALRAIPIVILTAYEHFEYVQKSYNLCLPAYVTKPCDPGKIRETLARIRNHPTQ